MWYKVSIDNTAGGDLTDYQVLIKIVGDTQFFTDTEGKREAIRVYDEDKATALSYWIEKWDTATNTARIWVKVPSIPGASIKYIYISIDPGRTEDLSSGADTFIFFDDFITDTTGAFILQEDISADTWFRANVIADKPAIIEHKFKIALWGPYTTYGVQQMIGLADSTAAATPNNIMMGAIAADGDFADADHIGMSAQNRKDGITVKVGTSPTDIPMSLDTYYIQTTKIANDRLVVTLSDEDRAILKTLTNTSNIPTVALSHLCLWQFHGDEAGSTYSFEWDGVTHIRWYGKRGGLSELDRYIDWILIRKYAEVEPAVTYIKESYAKTIEASASIRDILSKTIEAAAAVKERMSKTAEMLAAIKEQRQISTEAIATIFQKVSKDIEAMVAIFERDLKTIEALSAIKERKVKSAEMQAAIKEMKAATIEALAEIKEIATLVKSIEAIASIYERVSKAVEALAAIFERKAITIEALAAIYNRESKAIQAAADIREILSKSAEAVAAIREVKQQGIEAQAAIKEIISTTIEALVVIKERYAKTIEAEADIREILLSTIEALASIGERKQVSISSLSSIHERAIKQIEALAIIRERIAKDIQALTSIKEISRKDIQALAGIRELRQIDIQALSSIRIQATKSIEALAEITDVMKRTLSIEALTEIRVKAIEIDIVPSEGYEIRMDGAIYEIGGHG